MALNNHEIPETPWAKYFGRLLEDGVLEELLGDQVDRAKAIQGCARKIGLKTNHMPKFSVSTEDMLSLSHLFLYMDKEGLPSADDSHPCALVIKLGSERTGLSLEYLRDAFHDWALKWLQTGFADTSYRKQGGPLLRTKVSHLLYSDEELVSRLIQSGIASLPKGRSQHDAMERFLDHIQEMDPDFERGLVANSKFAEITAEATGKWSTRPVSDKALELILRGWFNSPSEPFRKLRLKTKPHVVEKALEAHMNEIGFLGLHEIKDLAQAIEYYRDLRDLFQGVNLSKYRQEVVFGEISGLKNLGYAASLTVLFVDKGVKGDDIEFYQLAALVAILAKRDFDVSLQTFGHPNDLYQSLELANRAVTRITYLWDELLEYNFLIGAITHDEYVAAQGKHYQIPRVQMSTRIHYHPLEDIEY